MPGLPIKSEGTGAWIGRTLRKVKACVDEIRNDKRITEKWGWLRDENNADLRNF